MKSSFQQYGKMKSREEKKSQKKVESQVICKFHVNLPWCKRFANVLLIIQWCRTSFVRLSSCFVRQDLTWTFGEWSNQSVDNFSIRWPSQFHREESMFIYYCLAKKSGHPRLQKKILPKNWGGSNTTWWLDGGWWFWGIFVGIVHCLGLDVMNVMSWPLIQGWVPPQCHHPPQHEIWGLIKGLFRDPWWLIKTVNHEIMTSNSMRPLENRFFFASSTSPHREVLHSDIFWGLGWPRSYWVCREAQRLRSTQSW